MSKICAEVGNNHCGDRRLMQAMIEGAAAVGVDIVKFQSFNAAKLRRDYPNYEAEWQYYKSHQLTLEDHLWLRERCKENNIEFLTTVFDLDMVETLADIGLRSIKIASPDANSWKLISKCLDNFEQVIISTGMHDKQELDNLMLYVKPDKDRVTLLHCVSRYPLSLAAANLGRMLYIRDKGFRFGYSDHCTGLLAAKQAISLGAELVEKHYTLNRFLPGKDQSFASTQDGLAELVEWRFWVKQIMKPHPDEEILLDAKGREKFIARWGCNK